MRESTEGKLPTNIPDLVQTNTYKITTQNLLLMWII